MTAPHNDNRLPDSTVPAPGTTPTENLPAEVESSTPAPTSWEEESTGAETPTRTETPAADTTPPTAPKSAGKPKVNSSFAAGTWIALIAGALLLILLLVFIVQNQTSTTVDFLSWQFTLPMRVWVLGSSIAGALIMAIVGGVRMFELRRQVKKAYRAAG